jgi:hypothetical protein
MAAVEAPRAGRREWVGLAVLGLACLVYAMDLTVLHLAVPHLSADLKPSSAQLLWIADIYGFMVAGALITMLSAANDAFIRGFQVAALVSAVLAVGTAVLAALLLRDVRPASAPERPPVLAPGGAPVSAADAEPE